MFIVQRWTIKYIIAFKWVSFQNERLFFWYSFGRINFAREAGYNSILFFNCLHQLKYFFFWTLEMQLGIFLVFFHFFLTSFSSQPSLANLHGVGSKSHSDRCLSISSLCIASYIWALNYHFFAFLRMIFSDCFEFSCFRTELAFVWSTGARILFVVFQVSTKQSCTITFIHACHYSVITFVVMVLCVAQFTFPQTPIFTIVALHLQSIHILVT